MYVKMYLTYEQYLNLCEGCYEPMSEKDFLITMFTRVSPQHYSHYYGLFVNKFVLPDRQSQPNKAQAGEQGLANMPFALDTERGERNSGQRQFRQSDGVEAWALNVDRRACYELTLTTNTDEPQELIDILHTVIEKKMFGIVKWGACFELTKSGLPHIHAILWTDNKYMDITKMKRYIPYRFELKKVRDIRAYLLYIKKEINNPIIIDYCERKGIPQFFNKFE